MQFKAIKQIKWLSLLLPVLTVWLSMGCNKSSQSGSAGPTTLTLDASFSQGTKKISGTLNLGASIPQGSTLILAYVEGAPPAAWVANEMKSFTLTSSGSSVNFQVTGLGSRTYSVWARVDYNNNGQMDAGDIGGYYVADPNLSPTYQNATLLDLTAQESANVSLTFQAIQ